MLVGTRVSGRGCWAFMHPLNGAKEATMNAYTQRARLFALAMLALTGTASLGAGGCSTEQPVEKPEPEGEPLDGKLDSFRNPTDHGTAKPGYTVLERLESGTGHNTVHVWQFEIIGPASLDLRTTMPPEGDEVDTVLYLYKQQSDGSFGRYIARNDDENNDANVWSRILKDVDAGTYRVLVKGHDAEVQGSFLLNLGCTGEGCGSAAVCLFGSWVNEIESHGLVQGPERDYGPEDARSIRGVLRQQILSLFGGAATDVPHAFELVGDDGFHVSELRDPAADTSYRMIWYMSYDDETNGGFFRNADDGVERVASLENSDVIDCTVYVETDSAGACGGAAGTTCGSGHYCDYPVASRCGEEDVAGTCRPVGSGICPEVYRPVCACNGVTYPNSCLAEGAGQAILHDNECPPMR